jgi:peptidoglycan hydrolase-like protein with peptidoglycan-binding domain
MATVQDVLNVAQSQIGYTETGGANNNSGNITKYWAELYPGGQGQPWCAAFQRWVDIHAKAPDLPVSNPYYCPSLVTYAKQHGLWDESGHYKPGDMVFFDWNGSGVAEHIGRVVTDDGSIVLTIEGNTSAEGVAGSQSDGGGVHERHRPHGPTIMGVLAYDRLLAHAAAHGGLPPRNPVKGNPFAAAASSCQRGSSGNAVKFVQWAVGVPVDGSFGPQTEHAVRLFQQYHRLTVDGIVGPQTISALRSVTH